LTPAEYEIAVVKYLRGLGSGLKDFRVEHLETVTSPLGDFIMDGVAHFEVMGGDFVVLVECKHHKDPIKRDVVQVLADKQAAVGAHKSFLFSMSEFQSGAIHYAELKGIALVRFMPAPTSTGFRAGYETRDFTMGGASFRPQFELAAWSVDLSDDQKVLYRRGGELAPDFWSSGSG
jgi:restriction system protein